jgi:hypothetical protein
MARYRLEIPSEFIPIVSKKILEMNGNIFVNSDIDPLFFHRLDCTIHIDNYPIMKDWFKPISEREIITAEEYELSCTSCEDCDPHQDGIICKLMEYRQSIINAFNAGDRNGQLKQWRNYADLRRAIEDETNNDNEWYDGIMITYQKIEPFIDEE